MRRRGSSLGSFASASSGTDCGQPSAIGSFNGPSTSIWMKRMTTKLSSRVMTTSSAPNRCLMMVGITIMRPPARKPAIITVGSISAGGNCRRPLPTQTAASAPI
ncbi:hypothetical protein D9M68_946620 [compost metagenome]